MDECEQRWMQERTLRERALRVAATRGEIRRLPRRRGVAASAASVASAWKGVATGAIAALAAPAASALTLSVVVDGPTTVAPGTSGIEVSILADEELQVGTTDLTLNWDLAGLQADAVSSGLSGFTYFIDNPATQVRTASSGIGADVIAAGDPLITFTLTALLSGSYELFLTDGDGAQPDDLGGPIPPIPPSIRP